MHLIAAALLLIFIVKWLMGRSGMGDDAPLLEKHTPIEPSSGMGTIYYTLALGLIAFSVLALMGASFEGTGTAYDATRYADPAESVGMVGVGGIVAGVGLLMLISGIAAKLGGFLALGGLLLIGLAAMGPGVTP